MKKAILILMLWFVIIYSSFVFASGECSDTTSLHCFSMNQSGTQQPNLNGSVNLTVNAGTATSVIGYIGNASSGDAAATRWQSIPTVSMFDAGPQTITFWLNPNALTTTDRIFITNGGAGNIDTNGITAAKIEINPPGGGNCVSTNSVLTVGDWVMVTERYNGVNLYELFVNESEVCQVAGIDEAGSSWIAMGHHTIGLDMIVDEVKVYNTNLTDTQISKLYLFNSTTGTPPIPPSSITTNLVSPINETISNNQTQIFEYNYTVNSINADNCSLWTNMSGTWEVNATDLTPTNHTNSNFTENNIPEGNYIWNVECSVNNTLKDFGDDNFTFTIDITAPQIVNTTFVNNSRYAFRNITGSWNLIDNNNIHTVNVTIPELNITIFSKTNISQLTYNLNISRNLTGITAGFHNISLRIADGGTDEELKGDYIFINPLLNNYVEYEFWDYGYIKTTPSKTSIFDKWKSIKLRDRYIQIYEPSNPSDTIVFTEESDQPIYIYESNDKRHHGGLWIVMGEHWKDYVLADEPQAKVNIKRIDRYTVEVTISNIINHPERLQFNSIGDLNVVTFTYSIYVDNVTETFTETIFNNFPTNLFLDFNGLNHSEPDEIILNFNNTNSTASLIISNLTLSRFQITITPVGITNRTTIAHNWFFNLTNVTEQTPEQNQTVINILVGKCDTTNNTLILNITYFDELNGSQIINVTNEFNLRIFDGTFFYNQTGTFNITEDHTLCTNVNTSDSNYTWSMWNTMEITKGGYVPRFIEFPIGDPEIIGNNPSLNLTFHLITIANSTSVQFTWLTTEFQTIDGIMKIYKCNPDGTRSLTDSVVIVSGLAVSNIQLLFQQYSYEITMGANTFTDASFTMCHQEFSNEVTYFVDTAQIDITPLIGLMLTTCTLRNTSVNTVTMNWSTNQNDLLTPIIGCMIAYRKSVAGNIKIYENCTTGTENSIVRTIPTTFNTYYVTGELRQGENVKQCDEVVSFFEETDTSKLFGLMGTLAVVIIILAMALMYAGEGKSSLFGAALGIIVSLFTGLMALSWEVTVAMLTMLIIVGWIKRYAKQR